MKKLKKMVLMRGIPGAGKSFDAERILYDALGFGLTGIICSTDRFFMEHDTQGNLVYRFDEELIAEYHKRNLRMAEQAIMEGIELIVVDNTNISSSSMRPYIEAACSCDYGVELREPTSPWWRQYRSRIGVCKLPNELETIATRLHEHNQHGVPLSSIVRMLGQWQNVDQLDPDIKDMLAMSA